MIAVGEMRSFEGVMDVLSSDNLSDFISIVKSFPKATDESNNMLFLAARAGDKKARELLLLTNLRLIVSQARLYQKKKKSYELLDTIQEGIIGFWEAIDDYKLEDNEIRFTPFITKCVKNAIVEAHAKRDADIRRPEKMIYKMAKYRRLKDEYQKQGRELPSHEELCRILGITSGVLKRIEQDVGLDTVSFP
ncbi:MAG TPA: hypothetical protein DCY94_05000, partial [Firmicutes bacterium]|nr:hypothetical protein [Bacillota bacterium]